MLQCRPYKNHIYVFVRTKTTNQSYSLTTYIHLIRVWYIVIIRSFSLISLHGLLNWIVICVCTFSTLRLFRWQISSGALSRPIYCPSCLVMVNKASKGDLCSLMRNYVGWGDGICDKHRLYSSQKCHLREMAESRSATFGTRWQNKSAFASFIHTVSVVNLYFQSKRFKQSTFESTNVIISQTVTDKIDKANFTITNK